MMLFHMSCPKWDNMSGPLPRLELLEQNRHTRTYRCELCQHRVLIEVDREEGAMIEPEATFK